MRLISIVIFTFSFSALFAQLRSSKFQFEINYGFNGNFFVRSYTEPPASNFGQSFYNKNFIGTIGGLECLYSISSRSAIGLGYSRSINSKQINFSQTGSPIFVQDFNIRHTNNFYQVLYTRRIGKEAGGIFLNTGLYYLRSAQQEVDITPFSASLEERNFKNSQLEELGVMLGFHYQKKIEQHFYFGLRTRFYFTISTGAPELISLTPTLSYQF
jgi:hypothetical protein